MRILIQFSYLPAKNRATTSNWLAETGSRKTTAYLGLTKFACETLYLTYFSCSIHTSAKITIFRGVSRLFVPSEQFRETPRSYWLWPVTTWNLFNYSCRSDYNIAILTLNYPTFISSVFQVVVVAVADEVLTPRAQTFKSLQGHSRRPVVAKSAQSWSRRSRSWSSAGNSRSSSSCRVEAWRNFVLRTNSASLTLRNQVLGEVVKKRVRWRRDSEKGRERRTVMDDCVRELRRRAPWGTGWWLSLSSQTVLNNFTQSFMIVA